MKNRILLLAAATMLLGWSCSDKNKGNDNPNPPTTEIKDVAGAQNALNKGETNITITEPIKEAATLTIPNNFPEGTEVSLTIPANGQDVTINQDNSQARSFPIVNVNMQNAKALVLNTPNCSVNFAGDAAMMTSTTANNTLRVLKGADAGDLTVKQGSVKIYGKYKSVTNQGSGRMMIAIGEGSDRPVSENIIRETLALPWIDGIVLTKGQYPLNPNIIATGTEFGQNDPAFQWYMPIEKEGFYILGEGDAEDIVLFGRTQTPNTNWSSQNLITVFADDVTIEGVTLMNKFDGNKMIEVTKDNFTCRECRFVPNTLAGEPQGDYEDFVGGVYFSHKANKGLVQNCYFNMGTVSVDGLMSGTFDVNNNTFDGVYDGDFVVISTPNWTQNDVSTSTMALNLKDNTFQNVPVYNGTTIIYPVLNIKYGTVTLTGNKFPTNGIYYHVTGTGKLIIDGQEHFPETVPQQ